MTNKVGRPRKIYPKVQMSTELKQALYSLRDGKLEVEGLGVFEIVRIPSKVIFHNFSKRMRKIAGYNKMKFTQSKELKELLLNQ
jgi:nucleoid DNA-binding protein